LLWSIESSLSTLSFDVLRSMVDQWTLTLQGKHSMGFSRLADFLLSIQNDELQTERFYKTSHQCCPLFSCIPVRFRAAPRDVMYLLNAVALSMQRHISCKVGTGTVVDLCGSFGPARPEDGRSPRSPKPACRLSHYS
jgi:hypothetical protein